MEIKKGVVLYLFQERCPLIHYIRKGEREFEVALLRCLLFGSLQQRLGVYIHSATDDIMEKNRRNGVTCDDDDDPHRRRLHRKSRS